MEDPERRFRNLQRINGLEANRINLLKVALEEWRGDAEMFGKRVDKRQKEVRNIANEIYQVVGFYSAFQGLLLTAVAQSNLLHCNDLGFPLALSALATFVAVVGIGQKSLNILQFNMLIRSEDRTRRAYLNRVENLKRFGTAFDFKKTYLEEDVQKPQESKYAAVYLLLISYEGGLVATLILFGGLCLATICQILCNPSEIESCQLFKYKMIPTKIFNRTGVDSIRVREGNGDVINMWFDIPPKKFEKVVIEPNATYRRFRIAPSDLEITSDYCTDNKIVYVRMDKYQKLFLDPVPRTSTMVKRTIMNSTSQSVVLKEVIDAKEGEHDIATTELEQLESRKSHVLEMDPEGEHRKYFMKVVNDPREIEITEHLKTSKKSLELTFDASGTLSFGPASSFLLGSYMQGLVETPSKT